jgi:hypothetical protein
MVSFMHIAKNVKVIELSLYEDAILDACCHNTPADDELWYRIVEVLVLLLACTQRSYYLVIIVHFLFLLNLEICNSFYLYVGWWVSLLLYIKCLPHERAVRS